MSITIEPFASEYANEAVQMWRASKEEALGQPEKHSVENHLSFLTEVLVQHSEVFLALDRNDDGPATVAGIMAFDHDEQMVDQLYINRTHQGQGIGTQLLDMAKQMSKGRIRLYTFVVNEKARRFYEKHGFMEVERGWENEEGLEDILFEWVQADSA